MATEDYIDLCYDPPDYEPYHLKWDEIVYETEKALLFSHDGEKFWIPKSICKVNLAHKIVTVPDWFNPGHFN